MSQENITSLLEQCSTELLNCAKNVATHLEGENRMIKVKYLDKISQKHCILDYQNRVYKKTLEATNNEPGELEGDLEEQIGIFRKKLIENAAVEQKKTVIHPLVHDLRAICKTTPVLDLNSSDLVETACTQDYIDPITKKTIQKPVKNRICGHLYDHTSIKQLIKIKKNTRCPVMGCGNRAFITPKDLIVDQEALKNLTQREN